MCYITFIKSCIFYRMGRIIQGEQNYTYEYVSIKELYLRQSQIGLLFNFRYVNY